MSNETKGLDPLETKIRALGFQSLGKIKDLEKRIEALEAKRAPKGDDPWD
tara:strand:- start:739 stop:888 length:150 start_codon:yes stop_codon:yes gene_type:complete